MELLLILSACWIGYVGHGVYWSHKEAKISNTDIHVRKAEFQKERNAFDEIYKKSE
ncbi:hypothetical protein [Bacillus paranthracis]|uniref:hypothetical protein n=1 Tax=Bacillus paranthracis TaxID=2026186 RepID=UPI003D647D76